MSRGKSCEFPVMSFELWGLREKGGTGLRACYYNLTAHGLQMKDATMLEY
jgi:hypothetical protein